MDFVAFDPHSRHVVSVPSVWIFRAAGRRRLEGAMFFVRLRRVLDPEEQRNAKRRDPPSDLSFFVLNVW
ncbi:MAG: hypothetical protein R3F34_04155 [Planctomycetota bacterium]